MIQYFLDNFCKNGEPYLIFLCISNVSISTFLSKYKQLIPIENLSYEQKKNLWLEAKRLLPDKTKEEQKIATKIIYTVGTLL